MCVHVRRSVHARRRAGALVLRTLGTAGHPRVDVDDFLIID